jgi:hypothetical protein
MARNTPTNKAGSEAKNSIRIIEATQIFFRKLGVIVKNI